MTRTYSQMHRTDKYSEHSSVIWSIWPNGWGSVYELSGSGFESSSRHLHFRFCICFEQEVPWQSGNYRVWINSETRTSHDRNIQLKDSHEATLNADHTHMNELLPKVFLWLYENLTECFWEIFLTQLFLKVICFKGLELRNWYVIFRSGVHL